MTRLIFIIFTQWRRFFILQISFTLYITYCYKSPIKLRWYPSSTSECENVRVCVWMWMIINTHTSLWLLFLLTYLLHDCLSLLHVEHLYINACWYERNALIDDSKSESFIWSCEMSILLSFPSMSWLLILIIYLLLPLQYGQRVPTAASPSNTNSSSSSNTGSQSGTLSTSLSNTNTNNTMGPSTTPQQTEQLSKTNLYIRGLQQGTTDKDLHNMCSQ